MYSKDHGQCKIKISDVGPKSYKKVSTVKSNLEGRKDNRGGLQSLLSQIVVILFSIYTINKRTHNLLIPLVLNMYSWCFKVLKLQNF